MLTPTNFIAAICQPAFLCTDPDGTIAEANNLVEALAGRRLVGCTSADLVRIFDCRRPDGTPLALSDLPSSQALRGEEVPTILIKITVKDGTEDRILATALPIREGDEIRGALSIWQEVNKTGFTLDEIRYFTEEEIFTWVHPREVARHLKDLMNLVEAIPIAIRVAHDPDCRVIKGYGRANEMYEAEPNENLSAFCAPGAPPSGRRFFDMEGHELEAGGLPMQLAAANNTEVLNAEMEVELKCGRRIFNYGSAVPLRNPDGSVRGSLGAFFDITDLKKAEASLRASNKELEQFAYVASHDLQEPLRSIVSFSQLLERRYKGKLDADADEYIGYIVDGGARMQDLITDLLSLSRVSTAGQPLVETDARAVLDNVLQDLTGAIKGKGATFGIDPMPRVRADQTQLRQVFANLIGNAIKYHRPDEPPQVHVSARWCGEMVEFSVRDNGIGIGEEHFDRIFVIFKRLHTRDEYGGTGIGLSIVKKIVERHGGTVRVESTPGEGSTFFFKLPAA